MEVVATTELEGADLPTWEYGWGVTEGPGVPEGLFVEDASQD